VVFVSQEDSLALVGDVVFEGSIGRTDLPGGSFETLMASIQREILSLPDETTLFPGHGPTTSVGQERKTNPFLVPHYGGGLV
jgi:glyoxylase-like metal-dependent hydrolase (beta-lactamase superfamily II)